MKIPLLLATLLMTSLVSAQEAPTAAPAAPSTPTPPPKQRPPKLALLAYKPQNIVGNVERRDGDGASRGIVKLPNGSEVTLPNFSPLTPKVGTALTTLAQPSLFTYQTATSPVEYRLTINEPGNPNAIFIYAVSRSAAGIHRVDLANYDVTLKVGVEYEWVVLFRPDPASPSTDVRAFGRVKRVEPDAALKEKLKTAASWELPGIYAEAGIWCDTLATLSDQIAANPQDKELQEIRANLLAQAKIDITAKPAARKDAGR